MANFKFACPVCTQRIAYDENAFGRKIRCPNCRTVITIPMPEGGAPVAAGPRPAQPSGPRPAGPTPAPGPRPAAAGPTGAPAGPAPAGRPASAARAAASPQEPLAKSKKPMLIGLGVFVGFAALMGVLFLVVPPKDSEGPGSSPAPATMAESGGTTESAPMEGGSTPEMTPGATTPAPMTPAPMATSEAVSVAGYDLAYLPADSELVVGINVKSLLGTPVGRVLASKLESDPKFTAMSKEAGLRLDGIDTLVLGVSDLAQDMAAMAKAGPSAMGAMGALQAAEETIPPFVMVARTVIPVTTKSLGEGAVPVDFEGEVYYKISNPQFPDTPFGVYFAGDTTVLVGTEEKVRQAMTGSSFGGDARLASVKGSQARHALVAYIPDQAALESSRAFYQDPKNAPPANAMNPLAPMTKVLMESFSGMAISLDATEGLGIVTSVLCKDGDGAAKLGSMFEVMLPQIPLMVSGFAQALPPNLKVLADNTIKSLASSKDEQSVSLSLQLPEDLFKPETGQAIDEFMMGQMTGGLADAKGGKPQMSPAGSKSPVPTASKAPEPMVAAAPATPPAPSPVETGKPDAVMASNPPADGSLAGGQIKIVNGETVIIPPPPAPVRGRVLKAWTMDFTDATIPDEPAFGMIRGDEFVHDEAVIENNVIILRQSKYGTVRKEVKVSRFLISGEKLDGKTYQSEHVPNPADSPVVYFRWKDPTRSAMQEQGFFNNYAIKFELGEVLNGRLKGKLFIAVPDGQKTFVSGSFDAEVR